jgi:hypothetical protein
MMPTLRSSLRRWLGGVPRMAKDRAAILKSMLDGVKPVLDDDKTKRIASALKAFSDKQLNKMDAAGVRIWPFVKGLPPEYQVAKIDELGGPADYNAQYRTVRVSPTSMEKDSFTDFMRHELAHAWDNVRTGKNLKDLRKLKDSAFADELNKRADQELKGETFESKSARKLPPGNKASMQEAVDEYKKLLSLDTTRSFAHPSTAPKHSAANAMEFYAEGYSVFHGNVPLSQGRLLYMAPVLFYYLEHEAKAEGLLRPGKDDLKKYLDENEKGWRAWEPEEEKQSTRKK